MTFNTFNAWCYTNLNHPNPCHHCQDKRAVDGWDCRDHCPKRKEWLDEYHRCDKARAEALAGIRRDDCNGKSD